MLDGKCNYVGDQNPKLINVNSNYWYNPSKIMIGIYRHVISLSFNTARLITANPTKQKNCSFEKKKKWCTLEKLQNNVFLRLYFQIHEY